MNPMRISQLAPARTAAAALAWRSLDALRGEPWPYCAVAFHRVWDGSRDELSYHPGAFDQLCRYWRDHFEVITLDRLLLRLARGYARREPALAITFDDGYADNAEIAAPILDRLGLNATFFVSTGAIGARNPFAWDRALPTPPPLMTWPQVRELHRAGFAIGSHTVSHPRLSQTRGAALEAELVDSRSRLESEVGEPVRDFAFPFGQPGDCDETAREAVRRAGYRCCLACAGGLIQPGESPFRLRRICVSPRYHPTPTGFREHSEGQASGFLCCPGYGRELPPLARGPHRS